MKSNTQRWLGLALIALFLAPSAWAQTCSSNDVKYRKTGDLLAKKVGTLKTCDTAGIAALEQGRSYSIYTPGIHKPGTAVPLVVALHGALETAQSHSNYTAIPGFMTEKSLDMIVVYPQGLGNHWGDGRLNDAKKPVFEPAKAVDYDRKFLEGVINYIKSTNSISKVYLLGMSNGGIMTMYMACNTPVSTVDFAGFAVVSASMYKGMHDARASCTQKTKPMLFAYGRQDTTMGAWPGVAAKPLLGVNLDDSNRGGPIVDITETIKSFCSTSLSLVQTINNDTSGLTATSKAAAAADKVNKMAGCDNRVTLFDVETGGHKWFDGSKVGGAEGFQQTKEIHATEQILKFWGLII